MGLGLSRWARQALLLTRTAVVLFLEKPHGEPCQSRTHAEIDPAMSTGSGRSRLGGPEGGSDVF